MAWYATTTTAAAFLLYTRKAFMLSCLVTPAPTSFFRNCLLLAETKQPAFLLSLWLDDEAPQQVLFSRGRGHGFFHVHSPSERPELGCAVLVALDGCVYLCGFRSEKNAARVGICRPIKGWIIVIVPYGEAKLRRTFIRRERTRRTYPSDHTFPTKNFYMTIFVCFALVFPFWAHRRPVFCVL